MADQVQVVGVRVDEGRKILLVKPTVVPAEIVSRQVDNFLLEALQNPRDRLTVLKLEQEIQKFLKNVEVQQLEFHPSSSYCQLAVDSVAKHYGLKTTIVDGGSKILVTKAEDGKTTKTEDGKNGESGIRLADIPPRVAQALQPRVAIKQRPASTAYRGKPESKKAFKEESGKSVEKRKEEYNKARARIFHEDLREDDVRVCCHIEVVRLDGSSVKAKETKETKEAKEIKEMTAINDTVPKICTKLDKENLIRLFKTEGTVKPKPRTPNRVAIIRDREKDKRDPDYDRSYDRYSQRYDPGFVGRMAPPTPPYNAQFDPCIRQPVSQQRVNSSWISPQAPPNYGYSSAPLQMAPPYSSFVPQSHDPRFFYDGFSPHSYQAFDSLEQHYSQPDYTLRQHY